MPRLVSKHNGEPGSPKWDWGKAGKGKLPGFMQSWRTFNTPCLARQEHRATSGEHVQCSHSLLAQLLVCWYTKAALTFATCSETEFAGFTEETRWCSCARQKGSWASFPILHLCKAPYLGWISCVKFQQYIQHLLPCKGGRTVGEGLVNKTQTSWIKLPSADKNNRGGEEHSILWAFIQPKSTLKSIINS